MNEKIGEDQVRQIVAAFQQYQMEYEAVVRELGLAQMAGQGLERALATVEALEKSSPGQEVLVPIGSGSFAFGKLASVDKIILNVGAGVSLEKTVSEAKESLKTRKDEVTEAVRKLNEVAGKLQQEMGAIQAAMDRYESQLRSEDVVQQA